MSDDDIVTLGVETTTGSIELFYLHLSMSRALDALNARPQFVIADEHAEGVTLIPVDRVRWVRAGRQKTK